MKRLIISTGMICATAFALTNCNKVENAQPVLGGVPFEITASTVNTRTENDGLNTKWVAEDALNVFHAEAGSTSYGTNDKFTFDADNVFKGTLTKPLEPGKSYDWYALYPYSEKVTTPAATDAGWVYVGHSKGANQKGNNSTEHLSSTLCPLYAVNTNVSADTPVALNMKHLTSVVKIAVTNSNDTPLKVSTIVFTATEDIVGSFYINFADPLNIEYTSSSTSTKQFTYPSATLNVIDGAEIAKGATAYFYIPIKPFTASAGSELKISVNGYEKSLTMPSDIEFTAGHIETVNFNYNKPAAASSGTVTWTASSGALGTTIASEGETATGTIYSGEFAWDYTRTLVSLASGKKDYVALESDGSLHLGSNNSLESLVITTSAIPGTIKNVSVVANGAQHNLNVTVGGVSYISENPMGSASTTYSGNGTSSGEIIISFTPKGTTKKALYIKSISVTYE